MTDREQILADSTSLLKADASFAETLLDPAPRGSARARKIKVLAASIARSTPSMKAPPEDPIGSLQRSVLSILNDSSARSLSSVLDRTNRHCPLTRCYFALREIAVAIMDIVEVREGVFTDWSADQALALGDDPHGPGRGSVTIGYRVDASRLSNAADELSQLDREVPPGDTRRPLVHACFGLLSSSLYQVRSELRAAGDNWLEFMSGREVRGRYTIQTIARPVP